MIAVVYGSISDDPNDAHSRNACYVCSAQFFFWHGAAGAMKLLFTSAETNANDSC